MGSARGNIEHQRDGGGMTWNMHKRWSRGLVNQFDIEKQNKFSFRYIEYEASEGSLSDAIQWTVGTIEFKLAWKSRAGKESLRRGDSRVIGMSDLGSWGFRFAQNNSSSCSTEVWPNSIEETPSYNQMAGSILPLFLLAKATQSPSFWRTHKAASC